MEIAASAGTLGGFMLALAIGGAVSGYLAGLLGVGGGAILVLILYQAMEYFGIDASVRMHVAIGTTLGIIIPTSVRSFLAHRARGAVDETLLRAWALPVVAGVGLGTLVAAVVSADGLKAIFAALALTVSLRMFFGRPTWRLGETLPGQPLLAAYGSGIGFLSVMMGVGGGVLANTVMTLYGRSIHQAVATSSGLGVLISVPGAIGFVLAGWGNPHLPWGSLGYVNLLAIAFVIPITFITAPLGVRSAHALSKRALELCFGVFLAVIGIRFLWDLI